MARLAFLIANLGGGGAERVAIALIRGFVERGHEVDLVVMGAEGELFPLLPASVRVFDLNAKRGRNVFAPLIRYLRERRPSALQVSMWPLTVAAIISAKLSRTGVRVVVSDHCILSQQYRGSTTATANLRASTRLLYPLADARIVVSAGGADDLAQLSHIRRDRFEVVYNPIPVPPHALVSNGLAKRPCSGGPYILTVGALKEAKNHALLIRAFAKMTASRPTRLVILGEGPLRSELEALAARLDIADRVVMPGFAVDPWPYYASADLFVLSSHYEGFGNAIVEAMHAGLPVVSTDCPSGPAEILAHGRYGVLVPCDDEDRLAVAMATALDSEIDANAQRERAMVFSGASAVNRYLQLMLGTQSPN
ncbi:MAG TPA: glycosyltransferase [Sphingomicrobium sp.]|nr:glycosyltransferase [Sphingomicrobium sp.]